MRKMVRASLSSLEASALDLGRFVFIRAPGFWARTAAIAARLFLVGTDLIAAARFFGWRMAFLPRIAAVLCGNAGVGWEASVTVFS